MPNDLSDNSLTFKPLPQTSLARVDTSLTKPFDLKALMGFAEVARSSQESIFEDPEKYGIARKEMRRLEEDDEIAQCLDTRVAAATAIDFRLELPSKPNAAEEKITPEVEFIYNEINKLKNDFVDTFLSAKWFGFAVADIVYANTINEDQKEIITLASVSAAPVEDFIVDKLGKLTTTDIRFKAALTQFQEETKILLVRHKATPRRPHGNAILKLTYVSWIIKAFAYECWAKAAEQFASPMLLIKLADPDKIVDEQTGERAITAALRIADAAGRGSALAVGPDDDVKVLEVSIDGTFFEKLISKLDARQQKVLLGQTLTSDNVTGGSNALGNIHNAVRLDKRDSDLAFMEQYFQVVVSALWIKNEFKGLPPKFYWQIPKNINQAQATRDKDLTPILKESKLRFNHKYFLDTYNIAQNHIEEIPAGESIAPPAKLSLEQFALANKQDAGERIEAQQLAIDVQPLNPEKLVALVKRAESIEELEKLLKQELNNADNVATFAHAMREARLIAAMMGYLSAAQRDN
jgi:phage gp29-like protein